jgi:hypothetical protein
MDIPMFIENDSNNTSRVLMQGFAPLSSTMLRKFASRTVVSLMWSVATNPTTQPYYISKNNVEERGMCMIDRAVLIVATCLIAVGCSPSGNEQSQQIAPVGGGEVTFVNRVWKVAESTSVATGQLYVFLSEGALVIASTTGTPARGTWTYDGSTLTMVEESIPYSVDILGLSTSEFRIRIHNPGGFVNIKLVPA